MVRTGGLGGLKEADETVLGVVAEVDSEIKTKVGEKLGALPGTIRPVGYKTQVVAGTNFFVKILVDEQKVVHCRIYRNLQGGVSLHSVTEQKSHEDDVDFF